jgi:hypothetical protein
MSASLALADCIFWQAEMSGTCTHKKELITYEQSFSGSESYESDLIERGFAGQELVALYTNDAAFRVQFAVDPDNRILKGYSYSEVFGNPLDAQSGVTVAMRDYYQAAGSEPLTVRIRYNAVTAFYSDGGGSAFFSLASMATQTDQTIYSFYGDILNITEGVFQTGKDQWLPSENVLGYQLNSGWSSGVNGSSLGDISYDITVYPGDVVAIDSLLGASTLAGQLTGKLYAEAMSGPMPADGTIDMPIGGFPDYRVEYSIEIIAGEGSFLRYSAPAVPPSMQLKQGADRAKLNLLLYAEKGQYYTVTSSTNLVDWVLWSSGSGLGETQSVEINTDGVPATFFRYTEINR